MAPKHPVKLSFSTAGTMHISQAAPEPLLPAQNITRTPQCHAPPIQSIHSPSAKPVPGPHHPSRASTAPLQNLCQGPTGKNFSPISNLNLPSFILKHFPLVLSCQEQETRAPCSQHTWDQPSHMEEGTKLCLAYFCSSN